MVLRRYPAMGLGDWQPERAAAAAGFVGTACEGGLAGGKTLPQIAINWCLCKDTTPIPGVKTMRQLEDNLGALGWS